MSKPLKIGAITALYRYPVKSMMGEELDSSRLGAKGLQGDRAFALTDPATGKIASAKNPAKWPTLFKFQAAFTRPLNGAALPPARITFPDGSSTTTDDHEIDAMLSQSLGKPIRFLNGAPSQGNLEEYWPDIDGLARRDVVTDEAMPAETFFDCAAVHLVTTATLASLGSLYPQGRFEIRRFRPNLVIETESGTAPFPENAWTEKVLTIGSETRIRVTGACGRCVMTTLAQGDLPKDIGILKTAAQHNHGHVGAYAAVLQTGMIKKGDAVWLESPG